MTNMNELEMAMHLKTRTLRVLSKNKGSMNRLKTIDINFESIEPNTHIILLLIYMSDRVCKECRRLSWRCECWIKKWLEVLE